MGLRKTFHTDKVAEIEGVTVPVAMNDHNGKPITITISRMSPQNKRYTKALEEATKPHQSAITNGALDNELGRKILQDVFVDTILLGWDNLPLSEFTGNDDDKELVPFSKEKALELFVELPDCYSDWEEKAKSASAFREKAREAIAGN